MSSTPPLQPPEITPEPPTTIVDHANSRVFSPPGVAQLHSARALVAAAVDAVGARTSGLPSQTRIANRKLAKASSDWTRVSGLDPQQAEAEIAGLIKDVAAAKDPASPERIRQSAAWFDQVAAAHRTDQSLIKLSF